MSRVRQTSGGARLRGSTRVWRQRTEMPTANPAQARKIASKFNTHCGVCNQWIIEGERFWWQKGCRPLCLQCHSADAER